jgi:hypothetical protein
MDAYAELQTLSASSQDPSEERENLIQQSIKQVEKVEQRARFSENTQNSTDKTAARRSNARCRQW